jgi:hypothetical protein
MSRKEFLNFGTRHADGDLGSLALPVVAVDRHGGLTAEGEYAERSNQGY